MLSGGRILRPQIVAGSLQRHPFSHEHTRIDLRTNSRCARPHPHWRHRRSSVHASVLPRNTTDWLQWLARRAGGVRAWWAPSVGEQVMVLVLSGELNATFVLPVINYQEGLRDRPDRHSRDLQYDVRPLLGSVRLTGRLWKMLSSPN